MRDPYRPGMIAESGMLRGYGWFHVPAWNISISAPPKCGSSSIKQFMWINEIECNYVYHKDVKGQLFFVVRDPISRFKSLWKSKCRDKANIALKQVHGMSPEELMSFIESGAKDVHWTPQHQLLGKYNATLIPCEQLNEWWYKEGYGELGIFNSTEGDVDLTSSILDRIHIFYEKDFNLYKRAVS